MTGWSQGRRVHLRRIASQVPSRGRNLSTAERLRGCLSHKATQRAEGEDPVAQALIKRAAASGKIRWGIDSRNIGCGQPWLRGGLAHAAAGLDRASRPEGASPAPQFI